MMNSFGSQYSMNEEDEEESGKDLQAKVPTTQKTFEPVPNMDISSQIEELKTLINFKNKQFEAEFEDLKRKHAEKLTVLKQNNITNEQAISSSNDLEYRNLIWTTTLRYLNRGCFADDLGPLFQQQISEEQYNLEKEIVVLRQKNEEELNQIKATLPSVAQQKRSAAIDGFKRNRLNFDIISPNEMAQIIYNKAIADDVEETYSGNGDENKDINRLIRKIQKSSDWLSTANLQTPQPPIPQIQQKQQQQQQQQQSKLAIQLPTSKKKESKRKKSPLMIKNDRYISCIETHQKACNRLQKSVKNTDKFLKNLHDNDWFKDVFPHVDKDMP